MGNLAFWQWVAGQTIVGGLFPQKKWSIETLWLRRAVNARRVNRTVWSSLTKSCPTWTLLRPVSLRNEIGSNVDYMCPLCTLKKDILSLSKNFNIEIRTFVVNITMVWCYFVWNHFVCILHCVSKASISCQ